MPSGTYIDLQAYFKYMLHFWYQYLVPGTRYKIHANTYQYWYIANRTNVGKIGATVLSAQNLIHAELQWH